jgi:hypothetical protein
MQNIKHHLPTFIREVRRGSSLRILPEGSFTVDNFFLNGVRRFLGLEESRLMSVVENFNASMESLESVSIRFDLMGQPVVQDVDFLMYLEASEALIEKVKTLSSRKLRNIRAKLERSAVALRYRLESVNGGLDAVDSDEALFHSLHHAAKVWKKAQQIFPDKSITAEDCSQLREACRYPVFVDLLLRDAETAECFFLWALRDRIAVRTFIEFPSNQKRLNNVGLTGRLSRLGGKGVNIRKAYIDGSFEKVLTLAFEGREVNILDDNQSVLFRGNYGLTIREIFQIFDRKRIEAGNLEYMEEGIINWNTHQWGYWDAVKKDYVRIDVDQSNWWKQLPVLERLTLQEARKLFGNHLTGSEWNLAAISTRLTQDLDFENSHSFTSVSEPQGDGSYIVYSLGKCTFTFPETLLQALANIGETSEATVAYPDENVFYTFRRKTHFSYAISEQEAYRYFDSVKKDVLLSREGNLIYQIESENCAKWSYEKLQASLGKRRLPVIFTMPFLDSEPNGPVKKVFAFIKSLPLKLHIPVTTFFHFLLGGYKGRLIVENGRAIWKSLTHHSFWIDTVIYHPSMLYKQQEEGNIGRFVKAGITLVCGAAMRVILAGSSVLLKNLNRLAQSIYGFIGSEQRFIFDRFSQSSTAVAIAQQSS